MEALIYLDTHVAAWLFAGETERIPPAVRRLLNREDIFVSPMAILELEYLHEIGRANSPAEPVVDHLSRTVGLRVCDRPFPVIIRQALKERWTRDPFDRVIVGHARFVGAPLASKDAAVRAHYERTVWED